MYIYLLLRPQSANTVINLLYNDFNYIYKKDYFVLFTVLVYTFADHKRAKLLKVPAIFFYATKYVYCLFN